MKQYLFALLLILVVALTACSTQNVADDSAVADNSPAVASTQSPSSDSSLDVVTSLECSEEQGHIVYSAGGYDCEDG